MPNHQFLQHCVTLSLGKFLEISRKIASIGIHCYAFDNDEQMKLMLDLFAYILFYSILE